MGEVKIMTEQELIKLSFEQRVKHAPYSIWIPIYNRNEFYISSCGQGYYRVDGVDYFVSNTSNCNGDREDVSISNVISKVQE